MGERSNPPLLQEESGPPAGTSWPERLTQPVRERIGRLIAV